MDRYRTKKLFEYWAEECWWDIFSNHEYSDKTLNKYSTYKLMQLLIKKLKLKQKRHKDY